MNRAAIVAGSDMRSYGGGEKDIIGWVPKIDDFEMAVFSPADGVNLRVTKEQIDSLMEGKVPVVYFNALRITFLRDLLPIGLDSVRNILLLRRYNTVYSMHQGLILNTLILLTCKLRGSRFILGIHSPIFFEVEPLGASPLKKFLMVFFRAFRKVLIMSISYARVQNRSDLGHLVDLGFRGIAYSIPPFIDTRRVPRSLGSNKNEFVALFVGRLAVNHKGVDLLCETIEKVLQKVPNVIFHIVGSGNDGEPYIRNILALYPRNVKWFGFLSEDELTDEFTGASIFLFPSRRENFGISLAEAQLCGLPSIAFKVMGSEDILSDDVQGTLIPPFDTAAFANAVVSSYEKWLADPEGYARLKIAISVLALERFSEARTLEQLKEMLHGKQAVD
ncbi:MAG: glycosyltransferase family 4 protein [Candidatus Thermoplasmatota archaeon]|jgi:glycosyltransferase involved in cell wall biosynthesis|nr:glycosyltransferase family 4 protein [Candidatus Thermoplasmatota archaeon]MCL5786461.1 glycosyltransferase family 4 protein [Candidatus Thermoplasmatota archaeon]